MKKNISILSIAMGILIILSILAFALETIEVKDYIKGKFPVIFNIYLASLGELDQEEKEFIDLLQNLPEEDQKNFAKEVYENGFSKETLENCRGSIIAKEEKPEPEIEEKITEGTTSTGKWICSRGKNPIDDTEIISFVLYSDSGKSIFGKSIRLVLRYQSGKKGGKSDLYINWYDYLSGSMTSVTYRFGTEKALTGYWAISADKTATFYLKSSSFLGIPSSKDTIKFIKKFMESNQFVARVTPYNENPVTAIFDIRGLRNAIEQFNDTLQWVED